MGCNSLRLLLAVSVCAFSVLASAADVELVVGTYTQGQSQGVYRLQFDSRSGRINPEPLQVFKADNPSWLTLSPDQRRLFVVNENGQGQRDELGRVSSLAIDPQSQQLSLINQVKTLGEEPTYSSLSADGRYLFVANYGVHADPGGSLVVVPIAADGQLQPVTQISSHPASRVNPERQQSAHVHSVVPSPDGRFVFACDLGADRIFAYRYDPAANPQHPLEAALPAAIELPPGSGPRHLWFGVDGKHAYLSTEMSAQVFVFDYQDGQLKQRQVLEMAPGMPADKRAGGGLHGSADGKFLYVSNRGQANELLVFAIDPASGELQPIQRRSVEGNHPREFSLSPDGKFLLVANQLSNEIVVLERDPGTGKLGKTLQKLAMDTPSDLKFINRP